MTGLFGWFKLNANISNAKEIENIANNSIPKNFNINTVIYSTSCLLGNFNLKHNTMSNFLKNKKGNFIVTCGEIYNSQFTNLDESILKLYETNKLDQLKAFNGTFAAAIFDEQKNKLTILNDRYGLIKLFYYCDDKKFCFGPKITPILKRVHNRSLRKDSILDFFLFGYVLENKTFFNQISQLPHASILEFSKKGLKIKKYWDYNYSNEFESKSEEELIQELKNLWKKGVKRRIKRNKKVIIPLSGGLDSRAILATALEFTSKDNITTFTFGEKGSYDFEIGKMIAKKVGVKNISLDVEKYNYKEQYNLSMNDIEGMIDATPYFAIDGYANMKNYGNIIFSGTKIDVLLGRHILSNIFTLDMLDKKIISEVDFSHIKDLIFKHQKLNDEKKIKKLFHNDFLKNVDIKSSFNNSFNTLNAKEDNKKYPDTFALWDYKNRWNKYIYFAVLRNLNLFTYITMLDADLVNFTLKLSPKLRLDEKLYIKMLLKAYPELYNLPVKNNHGLELNANKFSVFFRRVSLFCIKKINEISTKILQKNIFLEKKLNYIDYGDLLRRDKKYRDFMKQYVKKAGKRHFFNESYISFIWNAHIKGKMNNINILGPLVTFELFLERYIEGE